MKHSKTTTRLTKKAKDLLRHFWASVCNGFFLVVEIGQISETIAIFDTNSKT
jgi:hypothetical protein